MPPRISLLRPAFVKPTQFHSISIPRRPFFSLPAAEPQVLTATRTLPYPHAALFDLIANIDSYSVFVPYCQHSRVTRWTAPDTSGRRWPAQADLHVGWGGFEETFTSKVLCVPGSVVEARSGCDAAAGSSNSSGRVLSQDAEGVVFKSLVTRWSIKPLKHASRPSTEVNLCIQFEFANPLYSTISAAVSDKVAAYMIEAFESQAKRVLGDPKHVKA
jgi:coenzyme Q-binding protein COQ10